MFDEILAAFVSTFYEVLAADGCLENIFLQIPLAVADQALVEHNCWKTQN